MLKPNFKKADGLGNSWKRVGQICRKSQNCHVFQCIYLTFVSWQYKKQVVSRLKRMRFFSLDVHRDP